MREYQYEPLQSDEIRLLELHPGDQESDIHGVIRSVRLPEDDEPAEQHAVRLTREDGAGAPTAPPYSALSYTWGEERRALRSIHILQDGKLCKLGVKPNLHDALKRLRTDVPAGGHAFYWADAICINQADIPEKNAQIQKMAMIYNRAESVSVWLGTADKDSGRAIDFIDRLLQLADFDPLTQDPGTTAEWDALYNLMQRPWFNRRWIVQEISLARNATLYCGDASVSWPDFSAATALFVARHRDLRELFQSSKDFDHHPNYLGEVEALGARALVEITTNLFRKSDDGVVLERLLSLEALISTLTLFEAGSPHDTIYAVLWLAHDAEPHSRESAAMSMDPLVRTPTQSPEIDTNPSQFVDSQLPYGYVPASQRAVTPPATQDFGHSQYAQRNGDGFLRPPRRPSNSKPARSASDMSKMLAETNLNRIMGFQMQPHAITVDYDADVYDVFKQFLLFALSRSRSLDIICHPWAPEPKSRNAPALPSWIPQMSGAPFEKRPAQNSYGRVRADPLVGTPGLLKSYNASGKTKLYPPQNFIQDRTLVVTGFVLDAIRIKKSPAVEGIIPSGWLDLVDFAGPPAPVPDRLWRTLVADRAPGGHRYPPAYYPIACKWMFEQRSRRGNINTTELLTHGRCPSIAVEFLRRVQTVIWDRMLVLTEGRRKSKPLLALVPAEAEEGDLICILYGCSVPVVLRRQRKRKADSGPSRRSTRTESTLSTATAAPHISLSRASSNAAQSDAETADSEATSLGGLPATLDSEHRYAMIGECYVHGMMAGEGFKHQKDHGNKSRAFHII